MAKIFRCLTAWLNILDPSNSNVLEPRIALLFCAPQSDVTPDVIHDTTDDTVCGAALICEHCNKYHNQCTIDCCKSSCWKQSIK